VAPSDSSTNMLRCVLSVIALAALVCCVGGSASCPCRQLWHSPGASAALALPWASRIVVRERLRLHACGSVVMCRRQDPPAQCTAFEDVGGHRRMLVQARWLVDNGRELQDTHMRMRMCDIGSI